MKKIMFVCHGNICRSPMAEFIFKDIVRKNKAQDEFVINSSATSREEIGNDIHNGTKMILKKHGVPYEKRQAVQLTFEDYKMYDYIIAMDKNNINNIFRIIGEDKLCKVSTLLQFAKLDRDIADPWYTGDFDKTYLDIQLGCSKLFEILKEKS